HEVQPVVPPSPTTARAKASPETLSPPAPSDAQKAQLLVGEAGMALAEGDLDRARALLEQGLRLDPSNPRWRRLRQQLRRRGELARIQRMRAERLSAYLRQAVKHIEAQNYGRAIEAYERALRDDPNNAAAIAGKANALTLKQQLELAQRQQQQRPAVALTRRFIRGTTRYIPPPVEGAGKDEGPEGFQRRGRVEAKRATQAPKFPAEILIELRPGSVRAGDPFKLLIRMNNKGNGPVHVKFLELVWSFGGKKIGQGQQIPVRVQRVNARASVVLHEVDGIWTEEQSAGSLTATVTLLGNGKLANTLRW
ncbi:MAG: tetratricopeptide repeat protein, partial [Acidobacteriota bacterium]